MAPVILSVLKPNHIGIGVAEPLLQHHRTPSSMRCRLIIIILGLHTLICLISTAATLRSPIEPPRFLSKKSCRFAGGGCHCIVRLRGECCCKGNEVTDLPSNLTTTIRVLVMFNVSITTIDSSFFDKYGNLEEIEIYESPNLHEFDGNSLRNLTHLRKFSITWCRKLEEISEVLLKGNLKMQSLILRDNGLKRMPSLEMTDEHKMDVEIDLSGNQIQYIGDGRVRSVRARILRLSNNRIKEIAGYAFTGSTFVKLAINNNVELTDLSTDAFKGITELHHLDLSDTSISVLPIIGLKNLKTLALQNVPTLKRLPPVLSFTHLETAHFTYAHHCCLFKYVDDVVEGENGLYKSNAREIHHRICKQRETSRKRREQASNPPSTSDLWSTLMEQWFRDADDQVELEDDDLPAFDPSEIGATRCLAVEEVATVQGFYQNITCTPQPDAFNPCENIVGLWILRKAIWPVCTAAILGNVLVWVILGLAFEKRMRVHYLFMINLAIADLITGVYLAVLAVQDVRTGDEYYRHAVSWQTGYGCSMAGFFAVLSSELSIISMFFIAFEMAYNTRYAFYGQRLRFPVACAMMAGGWVFALMMATAPLLGLSSYSTASICLPLRLHNIGDRAYIIFFLLFNLFAFIAMVVCYGYLMLMLKDPSTPSRAEDNLIIKKMIWLVGADFLCWAPTLFFGLSAAMGHPLISLSSAKFLLVFFFPINASANPFLYVFFTKIIQRNVKTKALPMIRRITSTSGVALNTLSNFYHSQPPGRREEVGSPTRLGVSQMTSLNSTPRGSNCSNQPMMEIDTPDLPRRSTPRVSFQDNVSCSSRPSSDSTRPSFGWSKRISSIPEVSDLSEHSSESHHEHIPKRRKPSENQPRFGLNRFVFGRHRQSSGGMDSGRGSMASVSTRDTAERNSLESRDGGTIEAESDARSRLIFPPPSSEASSSGPRRSSWIPRLLNRHRTTSLCEASSN
ncbi:hypothetical protein V3C99_016894 [Haemonchus contortus]